MRSRRQLRRDALRVLRKHYAVLILIYGLVLVVNNIFSSVGGFTVRKMSEKSALLSQIGFLQTDKTEAEEEKQKFLGSMFDQKEGVFAAVINGVRSGAFVDTFAGSIESIIGSKRVSEVVLIVVSTLILFVFWFFIKNIVQVIAYRIYLEGRCYEGINLSHTLFLLRMRCWLQAAKTMFLVFFYQLLWWFTIIGGIVKTYAYSMVPLIVAENPKIAPKEAIRLSERMMKGHKFQMFLFELSYMIWYLPVVLLSAIAEFSHPVLRAAISFGSVTFLLQPLLWAGCCEFAVEIRKQARKQEIFGVEALNDPALYEKPLEEDLKKAYADVIEAESKPIKNLKLSGFPKFMADWFGITFLHSKRERAYEEDQARLASVGVLGREASGELYPTRLSAMAKERSFNLSENIHYLRHYSVWTLVMIFFTFSMIGWLWEVIMHLVQTGEYANRGVLNGPWLPIYGIGAVMALILLNRFRAHPLLEFTLSMVLCGTIEYFTGYILELRNHGMRWWDYSGYVLNLHGRICAEGLLVFGIGCVATVYVLGPLLDSLYRRIPHKVLLPLCIALTFCFCVDEHYSLENPNTGKGVTTQVKNAGENIHGNE